MIVKDPTKIAVNQLQIPKEWSDSIVIGFDKFCDLVEALALKEKKNKGRYPILAFDGFPGVEWPFVSLLEKRLRERNLPVKTIGIFSLYKQPKSVWKMICPFITSDPHFGKVFKGKLEDFLDLEKIKKAKERIRQTKKNEDQVVIWFGCGVVNSLLKKLYDYIFYWDLTRERFLEKIKKTPLWLVPSEVISEEGVADVGMSIQEFKLSQYVCYPVFDKQRRKVLKHMDFYVESNGELKILPKKSFESVTSALARSPIRLKPLYIQGPWGGKWIKKLRGLPENFASCAWAFEAVAPDMSLIVDINHTELEIPFITLLSKERERIMGEKASKKFGWFFPLRVHYDDSFDGGNMAIQVHPNGVYVKKHFNEVVGQHEAYYILTAKPGSKVYLGLKEDINLKSFYEEAERARVEKVPLDYEHYVNSVSSKAGDLFLIPAGTIHALGKDQVCLEIGTSYGYTFHVYDYLRPDLSGRLREIHLDHAFRAMKSYRKTGWVARILKQSPRILRKGKEGAEYLLGRRGEMPFEVRRLEVTKKIEDETSGRFHILTLVEGKNAEIESAEDPRRSIKIKFSETVIVPACFGSYAITGRGRCTIIKVLLKAA